MKKTRQIEKNAKTVNKYLKSKLKGNPKKLYDAAGHLIVHGGKRLNRKELIEFSKGVSYKKAFKCDANYRHYRQITGL